MLVLWWRRIIRVVPASLRDHDDKPPRARRRKTVAHQNNTVRAGIIALYNIFLIELKNERSKTSERLSQSRKWDLCGYLDRSIWCHSRVHCTCASERASVSAVAAASRGPRSPHDKIR